MYLLQFLEQCMRIICNYVKLYGYFSIDNFFSLKHLLVEDTEKRKSSADRRTARELLGFMKTAGVLSVDVVRSLGFIIGASVQGEKYVPCACFIDTVTAYVSFLFL